MKDHFERKMQYCFRQKPHHFTSNWDGNGNSIIIFSSTKGYCITIATASSLFIAPNTKAWHTLSKSISYGNIENENKKSLEGIQYGENIG